MTPFIIMRTLIIITITITIITTIMIMSNYGIFRTPSMGLCASVCARVSARGPDAAHYN